MGDYLLLQVLLLDAIYIVVIIGIVFFIAQVILRIPQFLRYKKAQIEILAQIAKKLGADADEIDRITDENI